MKVPGDDLADQRSERDALIDGEVPQPLMNITGERDRGRDRVDQATTTWGALAVLHRNLLIATLGGHTARLSSPNRAEEVQEVRSAEP